MELITGLIAGIISGTGMGGGSVLILILVNFLRVSQHTAQATNLIYFIPTAIVAIFVNYKQKLINLKLGFLIAIFGACGAVIGANISMRVDSSTLKKSFGFFLLIIAFYEIYDFYNEYKRKKKTNTIEYYKNKEE